MKNRKTKSANLENKRSYFTLLGLIIAFSAVLFAFEWKSYDAVAKNDLALNMLLQDEDMVEITIQKTTPPKPKPEMPKTIFVQVKDDMVIDDIFEIDVDVDENDEVDIPLYIEIEDEKRIEENPKFVPVEKYPAYPGGNKEMNLFLSDKLNYPELAKETNVSGTVYVQFFVEVDGSITEVSILRGIGAGCDQEAMRVVKMMPKWEPGMQRNKPVRVKYNIPVKFVLQN